VRKLLERFGLSIILITISACIALATPVFLTPANLFNILLQVSINTIIAVGMTVVIITGGIDLSVGSVVALAAVTMGTCLKNGLGIALSTSVGLGTGAACGLVDGFLVARCRVPACAGIGSDCYQRDDNPSVPGGLYVYRHGVYRPDPVSGDYRARRSGAGVVFPFSNALWSLPLRSGRQPGSSAPLRH
jgi:hypothetical protein